MLTRRSFLQSTAAGATLALHATTTAQQPATPVRVGVVGVGNRGTFLVQVLLALPGVEVNAICDIVPERAEKSVTAVEEKTGKRPAAYTNGDHDFENLCARDDLDAVITATPWDWHATVAVAAMRAGKYAGTEVPAATTIKDCWNLVRTSEATGMPCMMLENVCYFENVLAILRMVREGVFGDLLHCEAGYQHDTRYLHFTDDGQLTWWGEVMTKRTGNLYPTHPLGPVAQWMNINRGDRFTHLTSMSTVSRGISDFAATKFGPESPQAKMKFAMNDINTTLLQTAHGCTVTLYYDMGTPRPYDLIFRVQGTKGLYMGNQDEIYVEGVSPQAHTYERFPPYLEKYRHPTWATHHEQALATGGHGGADYITLHEFIQAVRNKTQPPQDVYDAATWSAVIPLSSQSATSGSQPIPFPDFTNGQWKTRPPVA